MHSRPFRPNVRYIVYIYLYIHIYIYVYYVTTGFRWSQGWKRGKRSWRSRRTIAERIVRPLCFFDNSSEFREHGAENSPSPFDEPRNGGRNFWRVTVAIAARASSYHVSTRLPETNEKKEICIEKKEGGRGASSSIAAPTPREYIYIYMYIFIYIYIYMAIKKTSGSRDPRLRLNLVNAAYIDFTLFIIIIREHGNK